MVGSGWGYEIVDVFRKTCEWKWIQVFHVKKLSHCYHAFLSHGRRFWRLKNKIILQIVQSQISLGKSPSIPQGGFWFATPPARGKGQSLGSPHCPAPQMALGLLFPLGPANTTAFTSAHWRSAVVPGSRWHVSPRSSLVPQHAPEGPVANTLN